jgi:hypothetical protein
MCEHAVRVRKDLEEGREGRERLGREGRERRLGREGRERRLGRRGREGRFGRRGAREVGLQPPATAHLGQGGATHAAALTLKRVEPHMQHTM